MRTYKTKEAAFTILEMLLVVTIIVLVIGASGGIYIGTYKKLLVKKSAMDFMRAARYARVLAIEGKTACSVKLDAASGGILLSVDKYDYGSGETTAMTVRDMYFKPTKFAGDVKFEDIQIKSASGQESDQNEIVFSSCGSSQAAAVQIGDGRNHYTVGISAATGKARLYEGTTEKIKNDTIDLDEEQG